MYVEAISCHNLQVKGELLAILLYVSPTRETKLWVLDKGLHAMTQIKASQLMLVSQVKAQCHDFLTSRQPRFSLGLRLTGKPLDILLNAYSLPSIYLNYIDSSA